MDYGEIGSNPGVRTFRKTPTCRQSLQPTVNSQLYKNPQTCFEGPFGEVIRANGPMAKANPFRFSTKYQDDESDLLYYGYRYYTASTGRWISKDPIEERGGRNLYAACLNNLVIQVDRLGKWSWPTTIAGDAENLDDCLDACDKICFKCGPINNCRSCYCYCWAKFPPTPRGKSQASLIAEWQKLHPNDSWPTCPDGSQAHAHHAKPLADGGADDGSNIEPKCADDHKKHHSGDGDYSRWGKRKGRTCKKSDPLDQE